jgi:hypothetical protein
VPLERTPGKPRVLLLGDSFVFGHGVEEDETVAAQLERFLPGCEVVNLGVTGYSTDQELLLLRERGLAYRPDVVILLVCANDLLDNGKDTAWGLYAKPRFLLDGDRLLLARERLPEGVPLRQRLARELNRRFVLYEFLGWKLARFRESEDPRALAEGAAAGRRLTRRLLLEICRDVAAHGGHLVLSAIPPFDAPEALDGLPPAGMGSYLDLEPVLGAAARVAPDSTLHFEHDNHWTPRGHRVVAEALAERIVREGWLTSPAVGIAAALDLDPRWAALSSP